MFQLFRRRRPCTIEQGVKLICPYCGAVVVVPMCKAVNGQAINCQVCRKDFIFAS